MTEKIKLVQGDTRPQVKVFLTDDVTGGPINLSGANVVMAFRAVGAATSKETLTAVVTNAPAGEAVFTWQAQTLSDVGDFEGEIKVEFGGGNGTQTVFTPLKFSVRAKF
jgi:hypothetical protein